MSNSGHVVRFKQDHPECHVCKRQIHISRMAISYIIERDGEPLELIEYTCKDCLKREGLSD